MKHFFLFSLFLAFCAGCAKTEFNYGVVCDFYTISSSQAWIVVSNNEGDILRSFELAAGQSQFSQTFSFKADFAEDSYNLHLVDFHNFGDTVGFLTLLSHYGVKNGAEVAFQSEYLYDGQIDDIFIPLHLYIMDLPSFDSLDLPGITLNNDIGSFSHYDAATHILEIVTHVPPRKYSLIRIRDTPSAPFRSLFIPTGEVVTDPISTNWNNLVPEANMQNVDLSGNQQVQWFTADAVSSDFQHSVTLAQVENNVVPSFDFPIALDTNNFLLRLSLQQGNSTIEKIFQPGEPLKMQEANMDIISGTLSPEGVLAIETEGAITMIKVNFPMDYQHQHTAWSVKGEPSALKRAILPDLSSLLPNWFPFSEFTRPMTINAYHYDDLNYKDLCEGLPYKWNNGKLFPEARYGLKKVSKKF